MSSKAKNQSARSHQNDVVSLLLYTWDEEYKDTSFLVYINTLKLKECEEKNRKKVVSIPSCNILENNEKSLSSHSNISENEPFNGLDVIKKSFFQKSDKPQVKRIYSMYIVTLMTNEYIFYLWYPLLTWFFICYRKSVVTGKEKVWQF